MVDDSNISPRPVEPLANSSSPLSIGDRAARGAVWFTVQMLCGRSVQFLSQIALSWLLLPKAFGLVGLTFTVTTVASALFSYSVGDIILQRRRTLALWIPQAFWLSFALGCSSAIAALAASPIAAAVYHTHEIIGLIAVTAISLPLSALSTIPLAVLRANLNFHVIATVAFAETLALQLLTLAFAYLGMAAFSFVAPVPLVALGRTLLLWYLASPIVITRPRFQRWKFLIANALAVTGACLLTVIVQQGDYAVLGIVSSSSVVGLYYFSYRIAVQPLQMLAGGFGNVLFPALSQFHRNVSRQGAAALKACDMISLIVTPACFLQAALAEPILHLLFSSRWIAAVPIIQILSIGLAFDAVSWASGALLHARGEFKQSFLYSAIQVPIFFTFVSIGALLGSAVGVAIGVAMFYAVFGPSYTYLIFRPMHVRLGQILNVYIVPIVLSAIIVGFAFVTAQQLVRRPIERASITLGLAVPIYLFVAWHVRPVICRQLLAGFRDLTKELFSPYRSES